MLFVLRVRCSSEISVFLSEQAFPACICAASCLLRIMFCSARLVRRRGVNEVSSIRDSSYLPRHTRDELTKAYLASRPHRQTSQTLFWAFFSPADLELEWREREFRRRHHLPLMLSLQFPWHLHRYAFWRAVQILSLPSAIWSRSWSARSDRRVNELWRQLTRPGFRIARMPNFFFQTFVRSAIYFPRSGLWIQ